MILLVIICLIVVSIGLSIWSLRNVLKMHEIESAKDTLSKSKILYQHDRKDEGKQEEETRIF